MSALPVTPEARSAPALPPAPASLQASGLSPVLVTDLLLKAMQLHAITHLPAIAQQLKLPLALLEPLVDTLRREAVVEVTRRGAVAGDVRLELTQQGRQRASDALARNQYGGPAPVPLAAYARQVRLQSVGAMRVTAADAARDLGTVVMPEPLREQLGAAVNSGRPVLLYGPPGAGKTYLCEQAARLLRGPVAIPHAIEVHGEIVRIFDPLVHRPVDAAPARTGELDGRHRADERWVLCHRPVVVAAGELTMDMLDLCHDPRSGHYQAPPHVKANNGLFLIDDLGRQQVSPRQLFNRWLLPMERGVDYLALRDGGKFELPFDLLLFFSSNLAPAALGDDAFLRRIAYKLAIDALPPALYRRVFDDACAALALHAGEDAFDALLALHRADERPTFACVPVELLRRVLDQANYRGEPPRVEARSLQWAWRSHFAPRNPNPEVEGERTW